MDANKSGARRERNPSASWLSPAAGRSSYCCTRCFLFTNLTNRCNAFVVQGRPSLPTACRGQAVESEIQQSPQSFHRPSSYTIAPRFLCLVTQPRYWVFLVLLLHNAPIILVRLCTRHCCTAVYTGKVYFSGSKVRFSTSIT